MASKQAWLSAARPKTLPASLAPVVMGIGAAVGLGGFSWIRSLLAVLVAVGFQIGVNFSNDYSDGIRGTDASEKRVGPMRLTGSGQAAPGQVLGAALLFYALACVCGLGLVLLSRAWGLLLCGALGVLAGWFYTGGKRPYGYFSGVSEVMVFVFFGWLAVLGTVWVQVPQLPWPLWLGASGTGLLSCALLMVNNLRDIPGDTECGKHTLAVRLGDQRARKVFLGYLGVAWVLAVLAAPGWGMKLLVAVIVGVCSVRPALLVGRGAKGLQLIACLQQTGLLTLVYGVVLALGWAWAGL